MGTHLDRAHGLPRLAHQERDVAQFGHGGQKLHVVGQTGLVLKRRVVAILQIGHVVDGQHLRHNYGKA